MSETYIIAEAGVNHNGSVEMAVKLVEAAAKAGADAVKFQTSLSDTVISRHAPKAEYQMQTTGRGESQLDMVKKLILRTDDYAMILNACRENHIEFLSTPFDLWAVEFLVETCHVSRLKLPSGEVTYAPLLLSAARTQKPIILSTGMCTLGDIERALGILAFGYLYGEDPQNIEDCFRIYHTADGQRVLREKVSLLHCTTEYPAPYEDVNLHCIQTMRQAFGLPVGYSDHTQGICIPMAAVACGARMIEKHLTLDRSLPGPDHKASIEPDMLKEMVQGIRCTEQAMGDGIKRPSPSERKNIAIARKSLVAKCSIRKGEAFTAANLTAKRPGTGISPLRYFEYMGKCAARDYMEDDLIGE